MFRLSLLLILLLGVLTPAGALVIPFSITKADDGFLIGGAYFDSHAYPLLLKVNSEGEEVWNRSYEENCSTAFWSVARLEDGYAVGGVVGCGDDAWVMKVDDYGSTIWQKRYGYTTTKDGTTTVLPDGKGIVAAITAASCGNCTNKDTWVVRYDEKGEEVWRREFNFKEYDSIKMMKKTRDGGFIAVGAVSDSISKLNYDVLVMKLDAEGREEWVKFFDLGYQDVAWDVIEAEDGYILAGVSWIDCLACSSNSNSTAKAFVLELDRSGNITQKRYLVFGGVSAAWSVVGDGKTLIAGLAINESRYLWVSTLNNTLAKINVNFKLLPIYGIVRMIEAEDGYLIVTSGCDGDCMWLAKLGYDGRLLWEKKFTFPVKVGKENLPLPGKNGGNSGQNTGENPAKTPAGSSTKTKTVPADGKAVKNQNESGYYMVLGMVLVFTGGVLVYVLSRF